MTRLDEIVQAQRETIAAKDAIIGDLRAQLEELRGSLARVEKEVEPLRLGRSFWNAVDEQHPAVDLLGRALDDWNRPHLWASEVRRYLQKIGARP